MRLLHIKTFCLISILVSVLLIDGIHCTRRKRNHGTEDGEADQGDVKSTKLEDEPSEAQQPENGKQENTPANDEQVEEKEDDISIVPVATTLVAANPENKIESGNSETKDKSADSDQVSTADTAIPNPEESDNTDKSSASSASQSEENSNQDIKSGTESILAKPSENSKADSEEVAEEPVIKVEEPLLSRKQVPLQEEAQKEEQPSESNIDDNINEEQPSESNIDNNINEEQPSESNIDDNINEEQTSESNIGDNINEEQPSESNIDDNINEETTEDPAVSSAEVTAEPANEVEEPPMIANKAPLQGNSENQEHQSAVTDGLDLKTADGDILAAESRTSPDTNVDANDDENPLILSTNSAELPETVTPVAKSGVIIAEIDGALGGEEIVNVSDNDNLTSTATEIIEKATEPETEIIPESTIHESESTPEETITATENVPEETTTQIETADGNINMGVVDKLVEVTTVENELYGDITTEAAQILTTSELIEEAVTQEPESTPEETITATEKVPEETTTQAEADDGSINMGVVDKLVEVTTVENELYDVTTEAAQILTTSEPEIIDATTDSLASQEVTTEARDSEIAVLEIVTTELPNDIETTASLEINPTSHSFKDSVTVPDVVGTETNDHEETTVETLTEARSGHQADKLTTVTIRRKPKDDDRVVVVKFNRALNMEEKKKLARRIAAYLNKKNKKNQPTRVSDVDDTDKAVLRRKRRDVVDEAESGSPDGDFTEEDILALMDGDSEISISLPDGFASTEELESALKGMQPEVEKELEVTFSIIPPVTPPADASKIEPQSVWDIHYGLFITIIVLFSVFIVVLLLYFLRCNSRRATSHDKTPMTMEEGRYITKHPVIMSSPFTDEEMVKGEAPLANSAQPNLNSAPPGSVKNGHGLPRGTMKERESPAVTSNGGGQHLSRMEEEYEFGVVPLDHLSSSEMNLPDVENTRF